MLPRGEQAGRGGGRRHLQDEVNQRQAAIQRGMTLSQVNQGLVQAMAEAVARDNDTGMRDLLASQGITIKSNAANAAKK